MRVCLSVCVRDKLQHFLVVSFQFFFFLFFCTVSKRESGREREKLSISFEI